MILTLLVLLLALVVRQRQAAPSVTPLHVAHGSITIAVPQGLTFTCSTKAFTTVFSSDDIMVYISPARTPYTAPMLESSAIWVEHVDRKNLTVCVKTSARIYGVRALDIQWLAFNTIPPSAMADVTSIPLWTTGTKCVHVYYPRRLTAIPVVFVAAHHSGPRDENNAAIVWTEDVGAEDFKICLREVKNFDGAHRLVKVHWLAMDTLPIEWPQAQVKGRLKFINTWPPPKQFRYSYCQDFYFPNPFYSPPTLIATVSHKNNIYSSRNTWPKNNAITYWIESLTVGNYQVCVKDLQPPNVHHDPIIINYLVLGTLHPCLKIQCGNYAKCKAYSVSNVQCDCEKVCPPYTEQRCAQNGQTYENQCQYEQMVCKTGSDTSIVKNGSCEGFSFKHGRVPITLDTADYKCTTVQYHYTFKPNQTIHTYLSVDYNNSTVASLHDTPTVWAESITTTSFRACVLKAGRNDFVPADGGLTFVNFVAYQGSPPEAVTGEEKMTDWWEGTLCKKISIPAFPSPPYVLVTAKHSINNIKHDAATVWVEDVNTDSFRICLRELQSFDLMHTGIIVSWVAFPILPEETNGELKRLDFPNSANTTFRGNTYCKDLTFSSNYVAMPTIVLSAAHQMGAGRLVPDYNSISAWVETLTPHNCTVCTRQHHRKTSGYDPLSVTVMLLAFLTDNLIPKRIEMGKH